MPDPSRTLQIPALGLIVVSLACVATLVLALGFDVLLLTTGLVDKLEAPPSMDKESQIYIRMGWALMMLAVNGYIAWGAYRMLRLRDYTTARNAAVLSLIPCVGPCFVLGLPFGFWALHVMKRQYFRDADAAEPDSAPGTSYRL